MGVRAQSHKALQEVRPRKRHEDMEHADGCSEPNSSTHLRGSRHRATSSAVVVPAMVWQRLSCDLLVFEHTDSRGTNREQAGTHGGTASPVVNALATVLVMASLLPLVI